MSAIPVEAITSRKGVDIKNEFRKDSLSLSRVFCKVRFLLEPANHSRQNVDSRIQRADFTNKIAPLQDVFS